MARPKNKYLATPYLIDGSPNLEEIAALTPPVDDRILFYDTAEGLWDYLAIGTGLTVDSGSKTLDSSGGSGSGGGVPGFAGEDGQDGERGMPGIQGATGATGSAGADGQRGAQGFNGEDGEDGMFGTPGLQGVAGTQGIQGVAGIQGLWGMQGEDGEDGMTIVGPRGATGPAGPGGFTMDVQDEGVSIQVDPTVMNFVGAGVTATALLGEVTVTIPGGAGASLTSYELDFGSVPTPDKVFTVTDAAVSATSKIIVSPNGNPATDRVGNDYSWDIINFSVIPATGTFDVYATVANGSVVGKRNIYYSVGA